MLFSPFERMVALRYLRARRKEGFVSVIAGFSLAGIALGVATLIIVMSVMNGFRAELLGNILGLKGHFAVYPIQRGPLEGFDSVAQRLRKVDGVLQVMPVVEGQVMATANGQATGAVVRGERPEDLLQQKLIAEKIVAGSLANFTGRDTVIIGSRMAQHLGLGVGDKITLVSPQSTRTAFGSVPRMKAYTIAAIFDIGMYEYDSGFIFMPLAAAQTHFRTGNGVTDLDVRVVDPERLAETRLKLMVAARAPVRIVDWQQAHASYFNALQVERNVMFIILTLIILVAAFNIISGLIMLVKDKGRDIAILRTMGATRGMVMRIFLLSGASVGLIGTTTGFLLGLAFSLNIQQIREGLQWLLGTELFPAEIYFFTRLPAKVFVSDVVSVVAMALILSLLATIYPAWRAARLDPVEALRYE